MGSACTSESRSPSPVYGRNGVILKRPPSITSYELRMERMNAEVAEVDHGPSLLSSNAQLSFAGQSKTENCRGHEERFRTRSGQIKKGEWSGVGEILF